MVPVVGEARDGGVAVLTGSTVDVAARRVAEPPVEDLFSDFGVGAVGSAGLGEAVDGGGEDGVDPDEAESLVGVEAIGWVFGASVAPALEDVVPVTAATLEPFASVGTAVSVVVPRLDDPWGVDDPDDPESAELGAPAEFDEGLSGAAIAVPQPLVTAMPSQRAAAAALIRRA